MASKKEEKNLQVEYDNEESCFGKLYDGKSKDCKTCTEGSDCQKWQAAKGNPDAPKDEPKNPGKKDEGKKEEPKKPAAKGAAAAPAKDTPKPLKKGFQKERDANGYVVGSISGEIFQLLQAGKFTKDQIEEKTNTVGKSTVSLFLSDVQKPVGTYPASRGMEVLKDSKGILSFGKASAKAKK